MSILQSDKSDTQLQDIAMAMISQLSSQFNVEVNAEAIAEKLEEMAMDRIEEFLVSFADQLKPKDQLRLADIFWDYHQKTKDAKKGTKNGRAKASRVAKKHW